MEVTILPEAPADLHDRIAYYQELARLRGELVGYLMSSNRGLASSLINEIQKLEARGTYPEGRGATAIQKQNLRDALAQLQKAVEAIVS